MDRNHDLIPPNTCKMVYGPGHQHFGSYGLRSDCSWFTSTARRSSSDTWGPVADAAGIEAVKEELAMKFKGWGLVQRMLEREVAVMIRVRLQSMQMIIGYCFACGADSNLVEVRVTGWGLVQRMLEREVAVMIRLRLLNAIIQTISPFLLYDARKQGCTMSGRLFCL
jgi:hypothetical protein